MMDAKLLDYDYDEEAQAFPEPPRPEAPPVSLGERAGVALVALGALSLALQLVGGVLLGTWTGILSSWGLMTLGGIQTFRARFAGTPAGIRHDNTFFTGVQNRGLIGWGLGIFITGFYVVLYFYDDWKEADLPPLLDRPSRALDPLSELLSGGPANRWFLYGFLYTLLIIVFGVRMLLKYRHSRYQQIRTLSVTFFQLGFAFLIPNLLKKFEEPEFYFTYFWPLKYDYLFPSTVDWLTNASAIGTFMVFWGAVATFVATPLLTYFYGKRWYCSWVCGCGGLAETLGDPWRQQSSKSTTAWKIERWMIHAVLVFIVITSILMWSNVWFGGSLLGEWSVAFSKAYGFYIGAVFSGVIGVGFYPLLGSRVWCRFGCPMAAILGLFQRTWSRFRITANGDQCMSCGNCSTYCEMGIDVRAYAQKGENIIRASCVGCGVCSAVCPRGVLNLENGMTHADRYDGADSPVKSIVESIKAGTSYPE